MRPDEGRPRFLAGPTGLKAAEAVARSLGIAFDAAVTRQAADDLHQTYFAAIAMQLGDEAAGIEFDAYAMRNVNAFAVRADRGPGRVVFDEQLDFWLFTCTHLNTVAACKVLEGPEYRALVSLFVRTLDQFTEPLLHERHRLRFLAWMLRHRDCLELSHALSRSMLVFVVCHEIAHIRQGHLHLAPDAGHEFEADARAASYFTRVIDAGASAGIIYVHPKLAGAPQLLMRYFDLAERRWHERTGRAPSGASHPSAGARGDRLAAILAPYLDAAARYVLDGFSAALDDLAETAASHANDLAF